MKSYSVSFLTQIFRNGVFAKVEKNALVIPANSADEITDEKVKQYARHLVKEGSSKAYNPDNIFEPITITRAFYKIEKIKLIPAIDSSNWVEHARKEDSRYSLVN